MVALQRLAGNQALTSLLAVSRQAGTRLVAPRLTLPVQQCGPMPCDCSDSERAENEAGHGPQAPPAKRGELAQLQRYCDPSTQSCPEDQEVTPPEPLDQNTCVAAAEQAVGCDPATATCAPDQAATSGGPAAAAGSGERSVGDPTTTMPVSAGPASLQPPGDCTIGQHARLQAEVDRACDRDRRCYATDDCATLLQRIQANQECIAARVRINATCFRGGDTGHQTAVTFAVNSLMNCWAVYERKCTPRPVPVPAPQPVRQEAPATDRGFMERMAAITGLSGAALIVYLIVSEGSRVVFPPRNLIPAP